MRAVSLLPGRVGNIVWRRGRSPSPCGAQAARDYRYDVGRRPDVELLLAEARPAAATSRQPTGQPTWTRSKPLITV